MATHKYIFYIENKGIRAYRACGNNKFEVVRYMGEELCSETNLESYFSWFDNVASIASDDNIDFCFLSDIEIKQPQLEYPADVKSSWTKDEIISFCQEKIAEKNFEISVDEDKKFVCQISNIYNPNDIYKIYLKCIPDFSFEEIKEQNDESIKNASVLYQYYREQLNML